MRDKVLTQTRKVKGWLFFVAYAAGIVVLLIGITLSTGHHAGLGGALCGAAYSWSYLVGLVDGVRS